MKRLVFVLWLVSAQLFAGVNLPNNTDKLTLSADPLTTTTNFGPWTIISVLRIPTGGDFTNEKNKFIFSSTGASDNAHLALVLDGASDQLCIRGKGGSSDVNIVCVTPTADTWYFAAVGYTSGTWNAYLTPICQGSIGSVTTVTSPGTVAFFRFLSVGSSSFIGNGDGQIAYLRAWRDTELNSTQILAEYNSLTTPAKTSNPAVFYNFANGALATDSSSNGLNLDTTNQGSIAFTAGPSSCRHRFIVTSGWLRPMTEAVAWLFR